MFNFNFYQNRFIISSDIDSQNHLSNCLPIDRSTCRSDDTKAPFEMGTRNEDPRGWRDYTDLVLAGNTADDVSVDGSRRKHNAACDSTDRN